MQGNVSGKHVRIVVQAFMGCLQSSLDTATAFHTFLLREHPFVHLRYRFPTVLRGAITS